MLVGSSGLSGVRERGAGSKGAVLSAAGSGVAGGRVGMG